MSSSSETNCPSERTLADYVAGVATEEEASSTAAHLETCDRCRCAVEWLQTFPQPSDPDNSQLFDETRGYLSSGSLRSQSLSAERFDRSILGPSKIEESLGTLDKYEITGVLGCGGMGVVFRAFDPQLRRPVAIKILNRDLAASQIARRRFIREARSAAVINHGNVVTIYAVEEHHDPPLLSMELVQGMSLREHVRQQGHLDPLETLQIAVQVAYGLASAHSHGVIHRDVKPANIMLEESVRRVKLTDFGLARAAIDNVDLTSHGTTVGTPAYMAPEQVRGDKVDSRTDLFALGCVIHAMLTGHSPFHGRTSLQIGNKVTDWNPPPLSTTHPAVPPFLSDIVEKLLQKKPEDRYQSAMEVAELINAHLAMINQTPTDKLRQIATGDSPWPTPSLRKPPAPSRHRPLLAIGVAAMLAMLAVIAFIARTQRPPTVRASAAAPASNARSTPVPQGLAGVITVSQEDEAADFGSISEALAAAGPGAIIRVMDSAEYETPLVIDNDERWRGVQLVAGQRAILTAPPESAVIRIHATQEVSIRGFGMRVALEQQGIEVTGHCAGLRISDLDITRFDATPVRRSLALFYLHNGAAGTEEQPMLIENVRVRDGNIGVFIGETGDIATRPPTRWLQVRDCDMAASAATLGYHVIIASKTEHIEISNNLFSTASCGVSLALGEANCASHIAIRHNTFYDLGSFLVLNESNMAQDEIFFHRNLIANTTNPVFQGLASDLTEAWFDENYWIGWTEGRHALGPIARPLYDFAFISTTLDSADYLVVKSTSPNAETHDPFPGCYPLGAGEDQVDSAD